MPRCARCRSIAPACRKLSKANPDEYVYTLAKVLFVHAETLADIGDLRSASALPKFNETLLLLRKLEKASPDRHAFDIADTLKSIADLHAKSGDAKTAMFECAEALALFRMLAESEGAQKLANVAATLGRMANLHSKAGDCQNRTDRMHGIDGDLAQARDRRSPVLQQKPCPVPGKPVDRAFGNRGTCLGFVRMQ